MHNNFTLDKTPKPPKQFYTVVEVAIHWARSEGAKSASDPRIAHYTQLVLKAIESGHLAVSMSKDASPSSSVASLSTILSFADLKQWAEKHFLDSQPTFLLGKK